MSSLYQFNMNKSYYVLFMFLLLYVKFNSAINCETVYVTCVENRIKQNATVQKTQRKCVGQSGITAKQFDRLGHTLSEQLRSQQTDLKEKLTKETLKLNQTDNQQATIKEQETIRKEFVRILTDFEDLQIENIRIMGNLKERQSVINILKDTITTLKAKLRELATSCRDYPNSDNIETIRVPGMDSFKVRCNVHTYLGGGWTIIMLKKAFSLNLNNRTWNEYKNGFGDLHNEFWIGLEKLHLMTKFQSHEIFIEGSYGVIRNRNFSIANEAESYKVLTTEGGFTMKFPTTDRDNDNDNDTANCAQKFGFGWWFDTCSEPLPYIKHSHDITVMIRPTYI